MSTEKKTRVMNPKGFLHKANTSKLSADGFLSAHKDWLQTGDLAPLVSPILRKLDSKEMFPTPALEQIKNIVLSHMMATEIRKGEEALAKRDAGPSENKPWITTIFNSKDEIQTRINPQGNEETLQKGFILAQDADRWADRRLVEGECDWYATVSHTTITVNGTPLTTVILRQDAMSRAFKNKPGPIVKAQGKPSGLGFGVKSKPSHSTFSSG